MSGFNEPTDPTGDGDGTAGAAAHFNVDLASTAHSAGHALYFVAEVIVEVALAVAAMVVAYWVFVQSVIVIDALFQTVRGWLQRD
jgi:hypothetical protein